MVQWPEQDRDSDGQFKTMRFVLPMSLGTWPMVKDSETAAEKWKHKGGRDNPNDVIWSLPAHSDMVRPSALPRRALTPFADIGRHDAQGLPRGSLLEAQRSQQPGARIQVHGLDTAEPDGSGQQSAPRAARTTWRSLYHLKK